MDTEPHHAPAHATALAGRSTDQRARSGQNVPASPPAPAAAQGCAHPAERDALGPVDQGLLQQSILTPAAMASQDLLHPHTDLEKKAKYAPRNTGT